MDKDIKYWYFRFTKDFFRDKEVRNLKHIPDGYRYGWIYLEMCALCLQDGSDILAIPKYNPVSSYVDYIAGEINEEARVVSTAISYFVTQGFIEILDGTYETRLTFTKMRNNIGRSSKNADRMRLARSDDKLQIEEKEKKLLEEPKKKKTLFDNL